jgi:hypothetical protein
MDELFAKIYIDECISPLLAKVLRGKGFDAISSYEIKAIGLKDDEQLLIAMCRVMTYVPF